jgi:hypothetical protein
MGMSAEIIGHKWKMNFAELLFELDFHSETTLSFRPIQPDSSPGEAIANAFH